MAYDPITFVAFDPLLASEMNQMSDNDDYFNTSLEDGWVAVTDSWSYASASTITVPSDATTKYTVGDRIRLKQGGGYKYYVIVAVASTTLTIAVNNDYTVANAAITDIWYSRAPRPFGFPAWFAYTPTYGGFSVAPTNIVRYNITGRTLHMTAATDNATGISNATSLTISAPVALKVGTRIGGIWGIDNTSTTVSARLETTAGSATMDFTSAMNGAAWTASNNKGVAFDVLLEMNV